MDLTEVLSPLTFKVSTFSVDPVDVFLVSLFAFPPLRRLVLSPLLASPPRVEFERFVQDTPLLVFPRHRF